MRILMVAQFYPPVVGGEERMVHDLAVELTGRGHVVSVATLSQPGLPDYEETQGVRVHRLKSTIGRLRRLYTDAERAHAPPAADPEAAFALARIVELEQPEIVHGHNWLIHSFLPLKRRRGPRLIVSLHDYSLVCANKRFIRQGRACSGPGAWKCAVCSTDFYGGPRGAAITVSNWLMASAEYRLVDLFLPVSRAVAHASGLRERGLDHEVIPNFIRRAEPVHTTQDALGSLPESFVLFVGDVTPDKGVPTLVQAHAALQDAPPLVLIGRIRSRASSLADGVRVRALGTLPHDAVLAAIRRSAVVAVPSIVPEAFGLVALEAMALGRPVVASRTGGLTDLVVDGKSGLLVPPNCPDELARALSLLLNDRKLRHAIARGAVARASEFSAERVVPKIEEAYARTLAKGASRR